MYGDFPRRRLVPAALFALAAAAASPVRAQGVTPCADSTTQLHPGEVRAGGFGSGSCRDQTGRYHAVYRLVLASDQALSITLRSTDASVDPQLRLETPYGKALVQDDSSGGGRDARLAGILEKGEYRLVAVNAAGRRDGAFELAVEPLGGAACARRAIAVGERRAGTFGKDSCVRPGDGPYVTYHRLQLTQPTAVELMMESADFSPYLAVIDADGDEVRGVDDGGNVARLRKQLDAGTYIIEAGADRVEGIGGYEFSVRAVTVPRGAPCRPADADDRVEVGKRIAGNLAANDCTAEQYSTDIIIPANYHRLQVEDNGNVRLVVASGLTEPRVVVNDAANRYVAGGDDTLVVRLAKGTYYVQVSSPTPGAYTLITQKDERGGVDVRCGMASAWDVVTPGRVYTRRFDARSCEDRMGVGRQDIVRLQVATPGTISIGVASPAFGVSAELADAQGNRVEAPKGGGMEAIYAEIRTRVIQRPVTPGTYYIIVNASPTSRKRTGSDGKTYDEYADPVGQYTLDIGPRSAGTYAGPKEVVSSISGFYVAGMATTGTVKLSSWSDAHTFEGLGFQAGMGLGRHLLAFYEYTDEIADADLGDLGEGLYSVYHRDGGARLYVTPSTRPVRLFVEGTYGLRTMESIRNSGEYSGKGWSSGAGMEFFVGWFTLRVNGSYGQSKYDKYINGSEELKADYTTRTLRAHLGAAFRLPL